jgi:ribosome recycling factor
METLNRIKELVEKLSVDTNKTIQRGNKSASIRARKYAQEIKELVPSFRREILENIKKHESNKIKNDR